MLNKSEKYALSLISKRINQLAKLENAHPSVANDYMTKSYLKWFETCSNAIDELIDGNKDEALKLM